MAWGILYLHGIGQGIRTDDWYDALAASLERHGIDVPKLQSNRIIRPDYVDLFKNPPTHTVSFPRESHHKLSEAEYRRLRAEHATAQAAALADLTDVSNRPGFPAGQSFDVSKWPLPWDLRDAREYVRNRRLRAAVLHRVIEAIGKQRDIVLIGHSLGSIVAIDLLAHLPTPLNIRRLVTIGSPAGALGLHRAQPERLLRSRAFPYPQVGAWVNLLSPYDPVTRGLGLSRHFPAASDVRISLPPLKHAAAHYLAHPAVAKVVADAVRPPHRPMSLTKDLDVPLTPDERTAVDNLLFGQLVLDAIKPTSDKKLKFERAHKYVAAEVAQNFIELRRQQGAPECASLELVRQGRFDALGFSPRTDLSEQLLLATVAATNNPIAPYEIDVEEEQIRAVHDLWTKGFGHVRSDADKVVDAVRAAKRVYDVHWKRYAFGAVGLAVLAAGPLGLVLAAPAGLAGAAAITASLASFGPGGMVGGMALAGTLIGVGSSTVVASLTGEMTADMLQTQCVRYMAFAKAQQDLGLPDTRNIAWLTMNDWRSVAAQQLEKHEAFSDPDTATVKDVRKKLKILDRAVGWMADEGLAPTLE